MIFWHSSLMGWMVCWQQGVEKTVEFASAYEADIADLHRPVGVPWTRSPQGMSARRILDCKLFAEDVVVSHRDCKGQGKLSMPAGVGWGTVDGVTLRTRRQNNRNITNTCQCRSRSTISACCER
jgi:hypothetical protein